MSIGKCIDECSVQLQDKSFKCVESSDEEITSAQKDKYLVRCNKNDVKGSRMKMRTNLNRKVSISDIIPSSSESDSMNNESPVKINRQSSQIRNKYITQECECDGVVDVISIVHDVKKNLDYIKSGVNNVSPSECISTVYLELLDVNEKVTNIVKTIKSYNEQVSVNKM